MALTTPRFSGDSSLAKASENAPPIRQGDKGSGVAIIQMALIDLGMPMPNSTHQGKTLPDGIFGSETALKLKQFQATAGLAADGIAGRMTLAALETAVKVQTSLQARQFAAAARMRRLTA